MVSGRDPVQEPADGEDFFNVRTSSFSPATLRLSIMTPQELKSVQRPISIHQLTHPQTPQPRQIRWDRRSQGRSVALWVGPRTARRRRQDAVSELAGQ